jgi:hypothetical protein
LIPTLGFFPINFMQHQLATHKIAGGMQRFRTGLVPSMGDMALQGAPANGVIAPTSAGNPGIQMPSFNPFAQRKSDGRKSLLVVP